MATLKIIFLPAIIVALASCQQKSNTSIVERPGAVTLDSVEATDFVATLESRVDTSRNNIYTPTFLYAWHEVKEELESNILVDNNASADFAALNASLSYQNSLLKDEYATEVTQGDGGIVARAFFSKTLPFAMPLDKSDTPILFDTDSVATFGMPYFNESFIDFVHILYYDNDDVFVLKLSPKDTQHEIILAKGINQISTLAAALKQTNTFIARGKTDRLNPTLSWKYEFTLIDQFLIPTIAFNVAKHYTTLQGNTFRTADGKEHFVDVAYQQTAFTLNEKGAEVEDSTWVVVDSIGARPPAPKRMIFNKPFYVIIKHVNKKNPYFVMRVANAELLTKMKSNPSH